MAEEEGCNLWPFVSCIGPWHIIKLPYWSEVLEMDRWFTIGSQTTTVTVFFSDLVSTYTSANDPALIWPVTFLGGGISPIMQESLTKVEELIQWEWSYSFFLSFQKMVSGPSFLTQLGQEAVSFCNLCMVSSNARCSLMFSVSPFTLVSSPICANLGTFYYYASTTLVIVYNVIYLFDIPPPNCSNFHKNRHCMSILIFAYFF